MKLRYRILSSIAIVLTVGLIALGVTLSYEAACPTPPAPPEGAERMKAIVSRCYGPPETLQLEEIEKPAPLDHQVLVKVHAAAANPLDWHYMRGEPYFMRLSAGIGAPTRIGAGADFSGVVEAVGKDVTRFKVGDAVFGVSGGAFAEYAVASERRIALKPASISFEQAASVPVAAITALQALREQGNLQPGQKVLINGASGGVGTFAVQIAKAMGAHVTGVCSDRNVELVRSLGADRVIDYKKENFTRGDERYDLIVDNIGNHSVSAVRDVLTPQGSYVMVGGPSDGKFLGPLASGVKVLAVAPFVDQKLVMFMAEVTTDNLTHIAQLMEAGKVTPVIEKTYSLAEAPEAIRHLETGRVRGKLVVAVEQPTALVSQEQ